jgi:hypothetical protein
MNKVWQYLVIRVVGSYKGLWLGWGKISYHSAERQGAGELENGIKTLGGICNYSMRTREKKKNLIFGEIVDTMGSETVLLKGLEPATVTAP